MNETVARITVKGFPPSLETEQYRGAVIHVVTGPASNNGYVVAPFAGVSHYDNVEGADAPGGWTFFQRDVDGNGVLGFDHAHSWDHDNYPPPDDVLSELRECVNALIDAGYITEESDQ